MTGVSGNADNDIVKGRSGSDVLSGEVGEERGGTRAEGTGIDETVDLAVVSEVLGASSVRGGGWGSEEFTSNWGLSNNWDVLKNVALSDDVSTGTDFERVSGVVVPVVVDSVEDGVTLNLGGSSRGVVDVVTLHGDHVVGSIKVDSPVVVTIISSRVIRETVDVVIGESNTVANERTENDVLTGNVVSGDMVNPDHIGVISGDSVTSPDVFGLISSILMFLEA